LGSSEYSSGNRIQRGRITKTGNAHLRRDCRSCLGLSA
jgi:transposase